VAGNEQNLKPWPKGESGNPGGRPKKKPITDELERLLQEQAPDASGRTWRAVIAESLLRQAAKGDVRAISELTNRIEGKPLQAVQLGADGGLEMLAEELEKARKRMLGDVTEEELSSRLTRLEAELGVPSTD
jgi:hypothetical protein